MEIQINTGHDVDGSVALTTHVQTVVKKVLHHLEEHLTRIEVYLDDENGNKGGGADKVCKMEARPKHHKSVIVIHKAASMHQAVEGATRKLKSSLEHLFGRLEKQHRHPENIRHPDNMQ